MIEIINALNKIKNAQAVHKKTVFLRANKIIKKILEILEKHNYISKVSPAKNNPNQILVRLKYLDNQRPAIKNIRMISKPGLRIYRSYNNLNEFIEKRGILIISTSKGILTDQEAKNQKAGGEIICKVV